MIPLMYVDPTFSWAFWIVYGTWGIVEFIRSRKKRAESTVLSKDAGSMIFLRIVITSGFVVAFASAFRLAQFTITSDRLIVAWAGLVLMVLGMTLRGLAVKELGKFFTFEVAVSPDQTVVNTGPYRYIRHPSYTGALITFAGTGLALTNWVSLAAIVVSVPIGYGYRMYIEERALTEQLGEQYAEYKRHTYRLIPFVY